MARPTPKDRSAAKQETREALVAAGLAEFAEKGLDAPSLDAICARAGYTRGAFYVHFRDRDDFLDSVMEKVFGAFLDAVIATGHGARDLEETVDRFVTALAAPARQGVRLPALSMDIHRVLDACARSPQLGRRFVSLMNGGFDRVAAAIRSGQGAGTVRADVDAAVLAQILAVLALGVLAAMGTGLPLNLDGARGAIRTLLAAPGSAGRP